MTLYLNNAILKYNINYKNKNENKKILIIFIFKKFLFLLYMKIILYVILKQKYIINSSLYV